MGDECLCLCLCPPSPLLSSGQLPGTADQPQVRIRSGAIAAHSLIALMAEPVWQELLRLRLAERNAKESAFSPVIEQCTCMPCLFPFSCISIDWLPDTQRSSACTTNKTLEGEECFTATCSGNC